MKIYTQAELGCMFLSLNTTKGGESRKFPFVDQGKVSSLSMKLSPCVEDGKLTKTEYELDLSTEEKALVLSCVKELDWTMGDMTTAGLLVEKLS